MAFVLQRLLLVAALAAVGLLVGLANEGWVLESEARPGAGRDSNVVTARGFPDAWFAAACFLNAIALGVAGRYVCRVPSLWPGGPGSVRRLLGAKG